MKKYMPIFLVTALSYSCKNGSISSVNNSSMADTVSAKPATAKASTPAPESIFIIADSFQTQNSKEFVLSSLAGKPTVVGMVFTNCGYACPRLTSDMKNIAEKLKQNRDKVNFVLVSFDTERDTPGQLKKFAKQMELDDNWVLLHGNEQTVRTLSVLLNVQFEKDAEGNFSHSNLISVLDKDGSLAFQKEGLESDHTETVDKVQALLK